MPIGTNYTLAPPVPLNIAPAAPTTMAVTPVAPIAPTVPKPTFLGGIEGALTQPHMSGALLRAGATLLSGGSMADAVNAGGGYVEHQNALAAGAHQQATENALKARGLDIDQLRDQQNYDVGAANAGTAAARAVEEGRHDRASEGLDANGQVIQKYGIDRNADTTLAGQTNAAQIAAANNQTQLLTNAATVGADNYRANLDYLKPTNGAAGIGSKSTTTVVNPAVPASNGFLGIGATPGTPKTTVATETVTPRGQPTSLVPGVTVVDGKTYLGGNPNAATSWR